jgi:protein-tyrosine-phosphatase
VFNFVITTCAEAQEACPQWPGAQMIHWDFPDPSAVPPSQQLAAFRRTRNELLQRIRLFVQANSLEDKRTPGTASTP